MKRRFLSLILAVLAAISLLSACTVKDGAETDTTVSTTVATSDAKALLESRLGSAEGITLGTAEDASDFGIDMSGFRDEGYIIRKSADETLILGKTEDGLDRGVRYYVKNCADADTISYAYGEGYKVKRITIGGVDIGEFDIYLFPNADSCHTTAASNLQKYISLATGITLDIVTEESEHMIVYEQIMPEDERFETLGDDGFVISVKEDGNLYISGGRWRGCHNGTWEFLEKYIGWRFTFNTDLYTSASDDLYYLYETDLIELPVGLEDTQVPSFPYRRGRYMVAYSDLAIRNKENDVLRGSAAYNGYGYGAAASHGMMKPIEAGYINRYIVDPDVLNFSVQPCYTDEAIIEATIAYHEDTIDAKLAAGQQIGREIVDIDVAQTDNDSFCWCDSCFEYNKIDGYTNTGAYVYFVNRIAEHFGEKYPEIYIGMFAYAGTNKPPEVTKLRENVNLTYCFFNDPGVKVWCSNHPLNGTECEGFEGQNKNSYLNNKGYAEELEKWCELSTRVTIWTYPANWYYNQLPTEIFDTLYEDMKYFRELGVYGIYPCMSYPRYWSPQDHVLPFLISDLLWNAEMTKEEYDALVEEYFTIFYGDAAPDLLEYIDWCDSAERDNCFCYYGFCFPYERVNFGKITADLDYCEGLINEAILRAGSAEEEKAVRRYLCPMYFSWVLASYTSQYTNGTEEERAHYVEVYERFKTLALETGFSLHGVVLTEDKFDLTKHPGAMYTNLPTAIHGWWEVFS